jgi:hypothetical protein
VGLNGAGRSTTAGKVSANGVSGGSKRHSRFGVSTAGEYRESWSSRQQERLRWIRLLEATEIACLDCLAPELEDSECHESNGRHLDTGRDSVVVPGVRRFVKVGVRKVRARVAVISIVEPLALGVVIAIIPVSRPRDIEPTGVSQLVIEMEMNNRRIKRIIETGVRNEWLILHGDRPGSIQQIGRWYPSIDPFPVVRHS